MVHQTTELAVHDARLFCVQPRDYQIRSGREHALPDRHELRRRLALTENHFGNSPPYASVIVEFGEAKILERQLTNVFERGGGSHAARGDTVEDFANSLFGHRRLSSSGRIGCASVNRSSRTARASLRVTVIVNSPSINFSPGLGICPSRSTTNPPMVAYSSASESLRPKRSFSSAIGARPMTDNTRGLTTLASSSPRSCSSSISPTISSIRSSSVRIPAEPPYSSTITERFSPVRCIATSASSSGIDSGK